MKKRLVSQLKGSKHSASAGESCTVVTAGKLIETIKRLLSYVTSIYHINSGVPFLLSHVNWQSCLSNARRCFLQTSSSMQALYLKGTKQALYEACNPRSILHESATDFLNPNIEKGGEKEKSASC